MFGHELFGPPHEPEVVDAPDLDCFYLLREWLREVHEQTQQALAEAGVWQKRAYDSHTGVDLQLKEEERPFPKADKPLDWTLLWRNRRMLYTGCNWSTEMRW